MIGLSAGETEDLAEVLQAPLPKRTSQCILGEEQKRKGVVEKLKIVKQPARSLMSSACGVRRTCKSAYVCREATRVFG